MRREAGGRQTGAERREAGRAIVKGAAVAWRRAGRGRGGPGRGSRRGEAGNKGRGRGTRGAHGGEGGLPEGEPGGGSGGGRKGEGGDRLQANAEAPGEREAREWS